MLQKLKTPYVLDERDLDWFKKGIITERLKSIWEDFTDILSKEYRKEAKSLQFNLDPYSIYSGIDLFRDSIIYNSYTIAFIDPPDGLQEALKGLDPLQRQIICMVDEIGDPDKPASESN